MGIMDKIGNGMSNFLMPYLKDKRSEVSVYTTDRKDYKEKEYYLWYKGNEEMLADFYHYVEDGSSLVNIKANYFYANISEGMRVVHSGLPKVVSKTMAKVLFNGDVTIETKKKKDQELLNELIEYNKLDDLNTEGATTESWAGSFAYKLKSNGVMPVVQLYNSSEVDVVFENHQVKELVFKTDYFVEKEKFRLYETYGFGYINYNLVRIKDNKETEVLLTTLPETEELVDMTFDNKVMLAKLKTKNSLKGESDYEGLVSEFDSLDEVWSNYIEEIRKGKTTTYIPENKVLTNARGGIVGYDKFKTEYAVLQSDLREGANNELKHVQPAIRSEEHKHAVDSLIYNICNCIGISPVSIGVDDSSNISGLSRQEKEKATLRTRDELIRSWKPFLEEFYELLLNAYNMLNEKKIQEYEIEVKFNDYITATMKEKVDAIIPLVEKDVIDKEKALEMIFGDDLTEEERLRILANVGETSMEDTIEEEIIPEVGE